MEIWRTVRLRPDNLITETITLKVVRTAVLPQNKAVAEQTADAISLS